MVGMNLTDLHGALTALSRARVDRVINPGRSARLRIADDGDGVMMDVEAVGSLRVTETAHKQIAHHAEIPYRYYDRMNSLKPALLMDNVHQWWDYHGPSDRRLVRALTETPAPIAGSPRVRGWLSGSYKVLDGADVLYSVLEAATPFEASVMNAHLSDEGMYVKMLTPRQETVALGQVVQLGLKVSNNEVGQGSVQVQPFMHCLWCENGLVLPVQYRAIHLGNTKEDGVLTAETVALEGALIYRKVGDWVRYTLDPENFDGFIERFRGTREVAVAAEPMVAVGNVVRNGALSQAEAMALLAQYMGEERSQFGVINAVTRVAQEAKTYERRIDLEELGGRFLSMEADQFTKLIHAPLDRKTVEIFSTN